MKWDWLRENLNQTTIDSNLLNSTGLETICGHNKKILDLGLNNFLITVEDAKILDIITDRLFIVNDHTPQERYDILKNYFPTTMWPTIQNLDLHQQTKLLKKKYKTQYVDSVNATPIDCSCIFDRDVLIDTLAKHFEFDHSIAKSVWDNWFQKQVQFGFVPDK